MIVPPILHVLARHLLKGKHTTPAPGPSTQGLTELAQHLASRSRARLGRSLSIRTVDAGSCNGCELELHAVNNPVHDLERLGLRFVASPRHADVLLVTGPVAVNMAEALIRTYRAMPAPNWVVAMGDCAVDGGCFTPSYAVLGGVEQVLPVDLRIPGCPPTPRDILAGLLALVEGCAVKKRRPPSAPVLVSSSSPPPPPPTEPELYQRP